MTARARVDAELVRRGLARSRRHAAELVAAGRVSVDGRTIDKPSAAVPHAAGVAVAPGHPGEVEYASRAGLKLAGALDILSRVNSAGNPAGVNTARVNSARVNSVGGVSAGDVPAGGPAVEGRWCVDVGASTGGFTDVLLRRGARHVVAIDVGHGQLLPRLREDPRVTVVEGKNVRDLTPADLDRAPDLVTGDLSFISLTLVLPALAAVLPPHGTALLLVKPQFEVGRERLGRGGVVRDPALHAQAVTTVVRAAEAVGLRLRTVVPSSLPGPSGNREFFVWLAADAAAPVADPAALADTVGAAVAPHDPPSEGAADLHPPGRRPGTDHPPAVRAHPHGARDHQDQEQV